MPRRIQTHVASSRAARERVSLVAGGRELAHVERSLHALGFRDERRSPVAPVPTRGVDP